MTIANLNNRLEGALHSGFNAILLLLVEQLLYLSHSFLIFSPHFVDNVYFTRSLLVTLFTTTGIRLGASKNNN